MAQQLVQLLTPVVEDLGYELWHLELAGAGSNRLLRLFIDAEDGISVEDCEAVSREVSAALDVSDPLPGAYRLEVSSPGLDRPLVTTAHFRRFVGERVRLNLYAPVEGRRRWTGVIRQVDDDALTLDCDEGELTVSHATIAKARLDPDLD